MPTHSRKTTLLATDQQRSVLNALDAGQSHAIAYSPYGYRPRENGLLSLLGFNGELPDSLTGHYHLGKGYRQFNPALMRFNSPDSWSPFGAGGFNAYAYCVGNPVNTVDSTGHTLEFLKPILRRVGLMDPAIIKQTQQKHLATAQTNSLKNIHEIFTSGETPRDIYTAQLKADKFRQIHSAALSTNPKLAESKSTTLTQPELIKASITRQRYSYKVMEHVSNTPPSPLLERSQKVTFSNQPPAILEIERLVPIPRDGWRRVKDEVLRKRSTLWSRHIRQPDMSDQT
jgi:RHS repeat-associated protein